jgi:hypothetical protein
MERRGTAWLWVALHRKNNVCWAIQKWDKKWQRDRDSRRKGTI